MSMNEENEILIRDLSEIDEEFADAGYDAFGNGMDYRDEMRADEDSALEQYARYRENKLRERKEERRRKRRRRRNAFAVFLLLIICGIAAYFAGTSAFFDVKHVKVEGNRHFSAEEIVDMSKAKKGQNIFAFNKKGVIKNLNSYSYIKNVKVKRKLPATVIFLVTERTPAAAVTYGERYIVLDDEGFVLEKTREEPQLTLLSGMTVKRMEEGKSLKVEESDVLEDTLKMLNIMKKNDLFFKKIEMTNVMVNAYIYDTLICRGMPQNILKSMEDGHLQAVLMDLYSKGTKRGVINVGDKSYCSFTPEY